MNTQASTVSRAEPHKAAIRILYLEDSELDCELVCDALECSGLDFETLQAHDQSSFESALRDGNFDLILCDYNLPGYDGFTALETARQTRSETPVLIISGSASEEEIVRCLQLGATDYILKHRLERLGPAVRRALAEVEALGRARAMEIENNRLEAQFLRIQRLENIGALAAGIAHDLNNALAPVIMGVELLKDKVVGNDGQQMLETMRACTQRGAEMVSQILSFARGVNGKPALLNIKHLVCEIVKLTKDTFPRSIEIESKVAGDIFLVEGNATQLHQVLLNLCVNARDAMPDGGVLTILAENVHLQNEAAGDPSKSAAGPFVRLRIRDTGCGMPPEVQKRIFEPFFTTKGPTTGTGLGLSTVKQIVSAHCGFVEVMSGVGQGTTFDVFFPGTHNSRTEVVQGDAAGFPIGCGELILLVDDDHAVLQMARETLETFGYRVLTARNGLEALPLYRQHRDEIAIVLTDMMMPHLDGAATIRSLHTVDPHVKIISMSGLDPELALEKTKGLPVHGFLKKPYSTKELLETLHEAARA